MTTYKNYEFFPEMKAAAAEKYGEEDYLILGRMGGDKQLFPPTHTPKAAEKYPGLFGVKTWRKDGDKYVNGAEYWTTVPNPGWPLTIDFEGQVFHLNVVEEQLVGGIATANYDAEFRRIRARLTATGLDVWDPVELAAAPFPVILGRNYLENRTFVDYLAERDIIANVVVLGQPKDELRRTKGTLRRLEYTLDGHPRVAYEFIEPDIPSMYNASISVVMAEPKPVDERDLNWVARMVKEAPDPRKQ